MHKLATYASSPARWVYCKVMDPATYTVVTRQHRSDYAVVGNTNKEELRLDF